MKTPEEIKKALACHASDYAYNGCHICPYFDGEECESGLSLDAHNYIEQLEAQIPKWISVKDRLPEKWQGADGTLVNYLIYMPEYGVDVGNYMQPAKTWVCMGIPCKVTHWMPLPEPPNA